MAIASSLQLLQIRYPNDPYLKAFLHANENNFRVIQDNSGDFQENLIQDSLKEQWKIIHEGGKPVARDCYAFCAVILASFHAPTEVKIDSMPWFDSSKRIELLRQLDMALLVATDLLRSQLHSFISLFSPPPMIHPQLVQPDGTPWIEDISLDNSPSTVERVTRLSLKLFSTLNRPVIITESMSHWPAMTTRRWTSIAYLKQIMGHRTVPVEVGDHYLAEDWTLKLMTVSEFLDQYVLPSSPKESGYLAQLQLFDHIETLRNDIVVPDYVTATTSMDPIINAWLGPSGTISPCHFDPYDNLLCQVVGAKYIRLFAPEQASNLYASESSVLRNTSLVDVEAPDLQQFPLMANAAYVDCALRPGEMLFIPKGWWHYVRSLSTSFSVSFWWTNDD